MPGRYPVVDLTDQNSRLEGLPTVDPKAVAGELLDIANAIGPVIAEAKPDSSGFGLQSIEIALTIGAEGGIGFVAKGSAEASITARFGRGPAGGSG
jgi:hypothetical protein